LIHQKWVKIDFETLTPLDSCLWW